MKGKNSLRAIMAVDDKGGVSKNGIMPWPKNSNDLRWFKKNTNKNVVIMGRLTWEDSFMPSPLPNRINVLISSHQKSKFPGADEYIDKNIIEGVKKISEKYQDYYKWIIGGPNIINQLFNFIEIFYLIRIYGDFNCDKNLDLNNIYKSMQLIEKINCDKTCHFEIWER